MADDAEFGFDKFWKDRGELDVTKENWMEPDESWAEECKENLPGQPIQVRKIKGRV